MKIGSVIATALVCSAIVLFASAVALTTSFVFDNGLYGAFATIVLYWAWLMGIGVLMSMEQRSKK